jgi:hypothetical protein
MMRIASSGINDEWRSKLSEENRRRVRTELARADVVYRMSGPGRLLLYVGVTRNLAGRLRGHVEQQDWWPEVERIEIDVFADRASAERAEVVAIWTEYPKHNGTRYAWQASCLQGYPELQALGPAGIHVLARPKPPQSVGPREHTRKCEPTRSPS